MSTDARIGHIDPRIEAVHAGRVKIRSIHRARQRSLGPESSGRPRFRKNVWGFRRAQVVPKHGRLMGFRRNEWDCGTVAPSNPAAPDIRRLRRFLQSSSAFWSTFLSEQGSATFRPLSRNAVIRGFQRGEPACPVGQTRCSRHREFRHLNSPQWMASNRRFRCGCGEHSRRTAAVSLSW